MVRLSQMWTGTLCLLTISGLLTEEARALPEGLSVRHLSAATQMAFYVPVEITNYKFTAAMLNPESQEYKDMNKDVCTLFNGVYNCDDCSTKISYGGVAAMTFSPGSVIANTIVFFNTTSINQVVVWALFNRNVEKATPKNLQINKAFTNRDNVEEVPLSEFITTTTPTTTTPTTTPTPTTTTPTPTTTTPTTTPTPTTTTPTPTTTTPTPTTTTPTPTTTTPTPTTTTPTPTTTTPSTTTIPTNTPTTTSQTIATGDTITTTPTTTPTTNPTAELTTEDITFTPTTVSDSPTASTDQNNSSTTNPGNYTNSPTSHGVDPTQDPTGNQTTTVDPQSTESQTSAGGSNDGSNDWVPAWAIALLVLAAVILLLLIIIFIMMLVRWCCTKTESDNVDTPDDPYYPEKKELPQESLPVYSPQAPPAPMTVPATPKLDSGPVLIGDTPKKNKTGFYAVNP